MHYPHPIELAARRKKLALLIALTTILIGLAVYFLWPRGPFHDGRSLTAWLDDYANPLGHVHQISDLRDLDFSRRMKESREAVKAIGTNALPTLLEFVQAKDSEFKKAWLRSLRNRGVIRDLFTSELEKHNMARAGFMILQKDALPAVPSLVALTTNSDPGIRMRAYDNLVIIESPDLKSLVPVLVPFGHDPDASNRRSAAAHMQLLISALTPEEAKADGVYNAFPELKPSASGAAH
jgi:hypothetical protein